MNAKKKKMPVGFFIAGLFLVLGLAYYAAAAAAPGLTVFDWFRKFQKILQDPFHLYFNEFTLKFVLVFFGIYMLWVLAYRTNRKNLMPGREMGSAQFADPAKVCRRLRDPRRSLAEVENIVIYKRK